MNEHTDTKLLLDYLMERIPAADLYNVVGCGELIKGFISDAIQEIQSGRLSTPSAPEVIKPVTNCPTCGAQCTVEGKTTHYYVPVSATVVDGLLPCPDSLRLAADELLKCARLTTCECPNPSLRRKEHREGCIQSIIGIAIADFECQFDEFLRNTRTPEAQGDGCVVLSPMEINIVRQWYNAVKDLNPDYLFIEDARLADKLSSTPQTEPEVGRG